MKSSGEKPALDALFNILEETELLIEIKDIRDELNILNMVLSYQKEIVNQLLDSMDHYTTSQRRNHDERKAFLLEITEGHQRHIRSMNKRVESVYEAVSPILP